MKIIEKANFASAIINNDISDSATILCAAIFTNGIKPQFIIVLTSSIIFLPSTELFLFKNQECGWWIYNSNILWDKPHSQISANNIWKYVVKDLNIKDVINNNKQMKTIIIMKYFSLLIPMKL